MRGFKPYVNTCLLPLLLLGIMPVLLKGQNVGIGSVSFVPNAAAMLEIQAGAGADKGLLVPRITNAQRLAMNPLPAVAQGLLVYQTDIAGTSLEGFYYNISTTVVPNWVYLSPAGGGGGWSLTGDGGTNAGINFIGTTDTQDWIIKTDNLERARVFATGVVTVNTTTANSGEVFTVFANGIPGATNVVGDDAINGYSDAAGTGVYGENRGSGNGIWGVNNSTGIGTRGDNISPGTGSGTTTFGVYGSNISVPSGVGIVIGVGGFATASTLDARGVNGQSQSANGIGVAGFNTAPSAANFGAHGVYGQTASQIAFGVSGVNISVAGAAHGVQGSAVSTQGAAGIRGINNSAPPAAGLAYGVWGSAAGTPTGTGIVYGVRGECSSVTGTTYGVSGVSATPTGFGVRGSNTNATGTGIVASGNGGGANYLVNGSGGAFTGTTMGAFAMGTTVGGSTGILAASNGGGLTTLVTGSGVSGSSTLTGVAGWANSVTLNNRTGGYFDANAGVSYAYVGAITAVGVNRKIEGNGTVNTTVKDLHNNLVVLSCPEAPENFFQDFGKGRLVNGKAYITLDPIFSKNIIVNKFHPLRVFIQPGADCKGVYVDQESSTGFAVSELQNGTSNAPFTWFVTANRADEINPDGTVSKYSAERFAPAMGPAVSKKQQTASVPHDMLNPVDYPVKPLSPAKPEPVRIKGERK